MCLYAYWSTFSLYVWRVLVWIRIQNTVIAFKLFWIVSFRTKKPILRPVTSVVQSGRATGAKDVGKPSHSNHRSGMWDIPSPWRIGMYNAWILNTEYLQLHQMRFVYAWSVIWWYCGDGNNGWEDHPGCQSVNNRETMSEQHGNGLHLGRRWDAYDHYVYQCTFPS